MGSFVLSVCTLVITAAAVKADVCSYYDAYNDYESFSCPRYYDTTDEDYCCGSGSSQYCCDYDTYYDYDGGTTYVNYGSIVGGIFAGIFVLVIIIVCAVCCCAAACPMYQRRHRGRVVNTGGTVVVASSNITSTHTHQVGQTYPTGQMPPPPNYGSQPAGYQPPPPGRGGPPPPAYGGPPAQQSAVYPPPNTTYPPPPVDPAYPPKY